MKRRGFSLLELLTTLAIVALLAAIALPGYGAIVRRAQRNDARLALLGVAHDEELHFQNHDAYTDRLTPARELGGLGLTDRSAAGNYALAVRVNTDGQHFTATAEVLPGGRQAHDEACYRLSIDDLGRRRSSDRAGNWSDVSRPCWQ